MASKLDEFREFFDELDDKAIAELADMSVGAVRNYRKKHFDAAGDEPKAPAGDEEPAPEPIEPESVEDDEPCPEYVRAIRPGTKREFAGPNEREHRPECGYVDVLHNSLLKGDAARWVWKYRRHWVEPAEVVFVKTGR